MTAYQQLEARFRRLGALEEAIGVLNWDAATMMPCGGAATRAEQLATLSRLAHDALTAAETGELLVAAESERAALGPWQGANLREMARRHAHAAAVPGELVEALSRVSCACEAVWREARPADDFAAVLPLLEEMLRLQREVAALKAARLGVSPYEALLDRYEPGGSVAAIDRLFNELAEILPELLEAALSRQAELPPCPPSPPRFAVADQRRAAVRLMEAVGFDFAHGRLDISAHPFSSGAPEDVRITTRYDERDFATALMGVLHETGHALYKRNLPAEWRLQPVGAARGMAVHESQSLLLEMQVCRSPAFMRFAAPILREAFCGDGPFWQADWLYRRQIRVARSLIRVEADEVTYPAHVILRYRLEQAMIAGDLRAAELPGAWAEGLRELLGVAPDSDRDGCLQDIHWYDGSWGYFPTYTLGALIAAQLFETACEELPGLMWSIAAGEFMPLFAWLRERVHARGSLLSTAELVENATGRPLDTASFVRHLRRRYLGEGNETAAIALTATST
ncbi:MAG TPA: carboxypeptidase M32 [Stellaceae bacterium]|nr:carboxypeptidase M32 [Stellaceae bacterium]